MDARYLASIVLVALACEHAPSKPPEPAPRAEPQEQVDGTVDNTYQTGDRPSRAPGPAKAPEPQPASLDRSEVAALAEAAVDAALEPDAQRFISPLLPTTWPPDGDSAFAVVYPLTPLEDAPTMLRIGTPTLIVRVSLGDGTTTTEAIPASKRVLGTRSFERDSALTRAIQESEETLLGVIQGSIAMEKSGSRLRGYQMWVDKHPYIAPDLKRHAPAFFEFVARQR